MECVDFVTDCETDFTKVTLKGKKEVYILVHFTCQKDLCELKKSLELLNHRYHTKFLAADIFD